MALGGSVPWKRPCASAVNGPYGPRTSPAGVRSWSLTVAGTAISCGAVSSGDVLDLVHLAVDGNAVAGPVVTAGRRDARAEGVQDDPGLAEVARLVGQRAGAVRVDVGDADRDRAGRPRVRQALRLDVELPAFAARGRARGRRLGLRACCRRASMKPTFTTDANAPVSVVPLDGRVAEAALQPLVVDGAREAGAGARRLGLNELDESSSRVTAGAPGSLAAANWPEPSERARNAASTSGPTVLDSALTIRMLSP